MLFFCRWNFQCSGHMPSPWLSSSPYVFLCLSWLEREVLLHQASGLQDGVQPVSLQTKSATCSLEFMVAWVCHKPSLFSLHPFVWLLDPELLHVNYMKTCLLISCTLLCHFLRPPLKAELWTAFQRTSVVLMILCPELLSPFLELSLVWSVLSLPSVLPHLSSLQLLFPWEYCIFLYRYSVQYSFNVKQMFLLSNQYFNVTIGHLH